MFHYVCNVSLNDSPTFNKVLIRIILYEKKKKKSAGQPTNENQPVLNSNEISIRLKEAVHGNSNEKCAIFLIWKNKNPKFCSIWALSSYSIDTLQALGYSTTQDTWVLEALWHSKNSKNSSTQGTQAPEALKALEVLYLADSRVPYSQAF